LKDRPLSGRILGNRSRVAGEHKRVAAAGGVDQAGWLGLGGPNSPGRLREWQYAQHRRRQAFRLNAAMRVADSA